MIRLSALLAAVLATTACGTVKTNSGEGGSDAPPGGGGDGGGPGENLGLPAIAGTWTFQIESEDGGLSEPCEVLIDDEGGWTVRCPYDVTIDTTPLCYQTEGRTELAGTWLDRFEGTSGDVETYAGTCEQTEVRSIDFNMVADRAAEVTATGFMARLAGEWLWTATDFEDPTSQLSCTATFTPTATSLDFVVVCSSEPRTVSPGCDRYDEIDIRGGVEATHFQAEMTFPASFNPDGCGTYDPPGALNLVADRTGD